MPTEGDKGVASLQDLADLAGVSRATASRAMNDSALVSARTRALVQDLAERHGYAINRRARNFRLSRTNIITVIFMLDLRSRQHMSDPFFLDMLGGIADALAEHDYDLLLVHAPIQDPLALKSQRILQQTDGVIFVGQGEQHEALNDLAAEIPQLVVWGQPLAGKRYALVGGDNRSGGLLATRHLLELGRLRIAFFGNTANPEIAARYEGYREALEEQGIPVDTRLKFDLPFDLKGAYEEIGRVMRSGLQLDAIFCVSDVVALAAMSALEEMDLSIPGDVAVVGYDDISLAAYSSPSLTTVSQNIQEAGRVLVSTVLRLIKGEQVQDSILDSRLVVRRSTVGR